MEFVETPTFWCPHVDRAACTNFSPRTVELRPPESQEILSFPFSPFLFLFLFSFPLLFPFLPLRILFVPFLSFFLSHKLFSFCFFISFLLFFLFLFSSHFPIISSSNFSFLFLFLFAFHFFSLFGSPWSIRSREEASSPFLMPFVWPSFFFLISLFLFMTSYPTWLNMSHGIMPPMWLNVSHSFLVDHMALSKCHTLRVPCGIPLPCHMSFDTLYLEKCEIPTTSESNEIRRGS